MIRLCCEILMINELKCHETGCPKSFKDEIRSCKGCGFNFNPDNKFQIYCSEDCYNLEILNIELS